MATIRATFLLTCFVFGLLSSGQRDAGGNLTLLTDFGIVSGFFGSSKGKTTSCTLLETAIADFLRIRQSPNFLYSLFSTDLTIDDAFLQKIKSSSGYDLRNSADLHSFSCALAKATSRNDVAKVLHMGATTVASYYHVLLAPVFEIGDLKKMQDVSDLAVLLLTWAHTSGYPLMPFRIDDKMTLKVFDAAKVAMKKAHVHKYFIEAPFPLKVWPTRALAALKESKTYDALEAKVMLNRGRIRGFAEYVKATPSVIKYSILETRATMKLLHALDKTGLLYIL